MRIILSIFFLFLIVNTFAQAQPGAEALARDNKTLQERYVVLKTNSQTYKDYKVIKETVLDAMWVVITDSIKSVKGTLRKTRQHVASQDTSLNNIKLQLKQKQESMQAVEHASTHIQFLGIDFKKSVFVTFIVIMVGILVLFIGVLIARLKVIHQSFREKADTVEELNIEYEDFKRKAMEKQTKLSRELQDERNKLQSMRSMG